MFETIIGIILLIAAVFLVVSVLLQSSKSHKLPGTVAGGAETFFGKTKGSAIDSLLEKLTAVVAIVFCVLVLVMYIGQKAPVINSGTSDTDTAVTTGAESGETTDSAEVTTGETEADTDESTAA